MQSPVLERLVGGVVLVGLLLLLALVIGPREELRVSDREGSESPGPQDGFEPSRSAVAAVPGAVRGQVAGIAALEEASEDPVRDAGAPKSAPTGPPERSAPAPAAQGAPAAAAPQPQNPALSAVGDAEWGVQLGSFAVRGNATRLSDWCREQGYDVKVVVSTRESRTLYRVLAGPFATYENARSTVARLALQGRSAFVTDWNGE